MRSGKVIHVWITKYALTQGIFEIDAEECVTSTGECQNMIQKVGGAYSDYYHGEGREWHRTEAAAKEHANKMVRDKIASLKKSIAKFEKLVF